MLKNHVSIGFVWTAIGHEILYALCIFYGEMNLVAVAFDLIFFLTSACDDGSIPMMVLSYLMALLLHILSCVMKVYSCLRDI